MPWVKYPFRVRHDGANYAPGETIEVPDVTEHVKRGATEVVREVECPAEPKVAPAKRKATKSK